MSLNQYAIYQLKMEASVRPLRYKTYQYLLDNHLRVDAENYHQVYLATMLGENMHHLFEIVLYFYTTFNYNCCVKVR